MEEHSVIFPQIYIFISVNLFVTSSTVESTRGLKLNCTEKNRIDQNSADSDV